MNNYINKPLLEVLNELDQLNIKYRIIRQTVPNLLTSDYNSDRLNIEINDHQIVTNVTRG